jgi:hypothetical protein
VIKKKAPGAFQKNEPSKKPGGTDPPGNLMGSVLMLD